MRRTSYKRRESQSGFQLIETLVALLLGNLYCIALLQICAETMRLNTSNTNKQAADLMAQTVLDAFKANRNGSGYVIPVGTYSLIPVATTAGQVAQGGHPLPVGVDLGDLTWVASMNKFPSTGTVTLTVTPGPDNASQTAIVTVAWSDSTSKDRSISTMTVVHQAGTTFQP